MASVTYARALSTTLLQGNGSMELPKAQFPQQRSARGLRKTSAIAVPRQNFPHGGFVPMANKSSQQQPRMQVLSPRVEDSSTSTPKSEKGGAGSDEVRTDVPLDLESRGAAETEHPFSHLNIGEKWREIQGAKKWAGLMDPMDPLVRGEVIRYGEFAQATYDAFDYNTHSAYCGSCKYHKKRLLQKVGLENRGYEVTDYIYATSGHENPLANIFKLIDRDDSDGIDSREVWDVESNWMGFVAVATDPKEIARLGRRDIVVAWRGTVTRLEWLENLRDVQSPSGLDPRRAGRGPWWVPDLRVEKGFLSLYKSRNEESPYTNKSAREQVLRAVKRLIHKYRNEELSITLTGHSLGSALAKLCAYDLAESQVNRRLKEECAHVEVPRNWDDPTDNSLPQAVDESIENDLGTIPITVFSFGGPRVGNDAFKDRMEELGVHVLRLVNINDKVPTVPGLIFNERLNFLEKNLNMLWVLLESMPWTYSHVGVELRLDNFASPFLRRTKDPLSNHNLEAYLHLLDGYHGTERDFKQVICRDTALVNKASNFLRPKHKIPPSWFQEENKGLKRTRDGRWVARGRDPEDYPEADVVGT